MRLPRFSVYPPGWPATSVITLRVDVGTAGRQLTNAAEIAGFSGGQDADSTPDRDPDNDGTAKNDREIEILPQLFFPAVLR